LFNKFLEGFNALSLLPSGNKPLPLSHLYLHSYTRQ
jgi:hypothetical protein